MKAHENPEYYTDTSQFYLQGGRVGVLLVHGFNGSPPEMRGLGDYLFNQGYTVLGVRLAGHGTKPEDMEKSRVQDWSRSAEDGLREVMAHCDTAFAVGHSMGGLLSLQLSLSYPIKGVVTLSPAMMRYRFLWPLLPGASRAVRWFPVNANADFHRYQPPYTVVEYPKLPIRSVQELVKLVTQIRKVAPAIKVPVRIMQGRHDRLIPASSGPELMERLGSLDKRLDWFNNSAHLLMLDVDRDKVWSDVAQFITSLV
jgi:carboxylesterase